MPNAIQMLRQDHKKVQELIERFEQGSDAEKEQICEQTLHELEVHAALEEELFYPAAKEHVDEEEQIDQALEEHHVAKLLLSELKKMGLKDERFEAKYKVLAESVKHHIEEEESEIFPMIESSLDGEELGQEMQARKEKLQQKMMGRSTSKSKTQSRGRAGKGARSRQTGRQKGRKRASSGRR